MTEKQNKFFIKNQFWRPHYKNWNWTIVDENDEIVIELPFEENCEKVLELLMKYIDENEQLKSELAEVRKENYGNLDGIGYYQEENASLREKISDLECENEQLKCKIELLENSIDMLKGEKELVE